MNKVLLVGRLTHEPEKITTSSGITYVRFSIAVSRAFSKDKTDFIPIIAWRQTADFVTNYMHKGYLISIDGMFTSSKYKNANDQMITRYEVIAERVSNLEPKKDNQNINGTSEFAMKNDAISDIVKKPENMKLKTEEKIPWDIEF